jgi:glucose 1-dehydrogenase
VWAVEVMMFAVGLIKNKTGVFDFEIPAPEIKNPDEVLIRIKEVGLDGTDINLVRYNLQDLPPGRDTMTMGHEAAGVVEEVGSGVKSVKPEDIVVITVRRG